MQNESQESSRNEETEDDENEEGVIDSQPFDFLFIL